jgi:signal transduction histidine kinase
MQGSLEQPLHREMAGSIARGAIHLTQLLTDILDLSKVEAGAMPLTYQDHDLRALLQSTADFFGPTAIGKGLKLTVEVAGDVPQTLACDSLKLQQILNNLLCNAIKFTEVGSVVIRAERSGESISIHVDDTGPGIPQPLREAIFEKFRQANGHISNEHGGTGLGLALSRGLAELMRGRLTVGPADGGGSRFTVTLPIASAGPIRTRPLAMT